MKKWIKFILHVFIVHRCSVIDWLKGHFRWRVRCPVCKRKPINYHRIKHFFIDDPHMVYRPCGCKQTLFQANKNKFFRLNKLDHSIVKCHEPPVMNKLMGIKGNLFVDVGASIGQYAVALRSNFHRLICIEPDPRNLDVLGVLQPKLRFELLDVALSDFEGEGNLVLTPSLGGSQIMRSVQDGKYVPIKITTLNRVVEQLGLKEIDLIKVDVEGEEVKLLQGALEVANRVKRWIVEVHSIKNLHEIYSMLMKEGYSLEILWKHNIPNYSEPITHIYAVKNF